MKHIFLLVPLFVLVHTAWADTRDLNGKLQFVEPNQDVKYHVDWPLISTKGGQKFTIRYVDGTPYLQSFIKEPKSNSLFSKENM
ncbi:hypothetical protein [Citrobacter gillenii]|uniref:hypothetical protein n=1 Tax=Citrobacter gillenii TaxID=67828 RepID=UPI00311CD75D